MSRLNLLLGVMLMWAMPSAHSENLSLPTPAGYVARASSESERLPGEMWAYVLASDARISFRVLSIRHEQADINEVIDTLQSRTSAVKRMPDGVLGPIERIEQQDLIAWAWSDQYRLASAPASTWQDRYLVLEGHQETVVLCLHGPVDWMQTHATQLVSFAHLLQGFVPDAAREEPFELVRLNPVAH